jgi:hypothetical protein
LSINIVAMGRPEASVTAVACAPRSQREIQNARQNAGGFRRVDSIGDCRHGSLERNWVSLRNVCRSRGAGDDRESRVIEGKRHIDWATVIEGRCDQSLGLRDTVVRGHDRSCTDQWLGHLVKEIELAVAQRVMNEAMRLLLSGGRHADQMEDRYVLGISAANAANRAELAHGVGGADCANATNAGVAVGRIGGVELVAASDPAQSRIGANSVIDGESKVSGDAEDVFHAEVMQARKHVLDYGLGHASAS